MTFYDFKFNLLTYKIKVIFEVIGNKIIIFLLQFKILTYSIKNNNKKILWTYKLNSPCQNFILQRLLYTFKNSSDCLVKKVSCFVDVHLLHYHYTFLLFTFLVPGHLFEKNELFSSLTFTIFTFVPFAVIPYLNSH